jgi:hypothetical protein
MNLLSIVSFHDILTWLLLEEGWKIIMNKKMKGTILLLSSVLVMGGCGSNNGDQTQQEFAGKVTEIAEDMQGAAELQKEVLVTENEKPEDTQSAPDTETELLETESLKTESSEMEIPETETEKPADGIDAETVSGNMPVISVTDDRKEWYSEDGKEIIYWVEKSIVTIENEGFDVLKNVFAERWGGIGDEAIYEETVEEAKESYEKKKEDGFFVLGFTYDGVELGRCNSSFASFIECSEIYSGAADADYIGLTFDVKSGKELQLCDILSDEEGFCREAANYIADKWDEEYKSAGIAESHKGTDGKYLPEEFEEDIKEVMKAPADPNMLGKQWYLSEEGFVLVYQQWSLGMHAETLVTVPYEKINQYLKPEYAKP